MRNFRIKTKLETPSAPKICEILAQMGFYLKTHLTIGDYYPIGYLVTTST